MSSAARLVIDDQNPWPGLGAFDEAAQHFFNGRGNETAELRRLVLNSSLTVLFGASGLGKTSLIQAGLFPSSRKEHFLPIYVRLDVSDKTEPLIEQVNRAFKQEVGAHVVDAPPFHEGETLWEYLHRPGLELWSPRNQLLTPLFVFDQFEEVFTLGAENAAATRQLRTDLADLIENRVPDTLAKACLVNEAATADLELNHQRYRVVLSFREDFLPAVESWKRDLPSILRNRLRLLPMSKERALEAIHKTAPHLVSEKVAGEIVRFVAGAREEGAGKTSEASGDESDLPVEPALLSLVCHGLNEKRKAQGKTAFDEDLVAGSAKSIVSEFYQDAVHDLPEHVRNFIRRELITTGGFRKPCDVDDARKKHGVTDQQLHLLIDRRLLRIEPYRGSERVELTHDLLTNVVREDRDLYDAKARVRQRLKQAAVAVGIVLLLGGSLFWARAAKQQAYVREKEKEARDAQDKLKALMTEQQLATEQAKEREAEEKAAEARRDADNAQKARNEISVQLLASSAALKGTEGESALPVSMLLAAESMRRQPLIDNQAVLSKGLPLLPKSLGWSPNSAIQTMTFSRDGLMVTSEPNFVRVWDPVTHKQLRQFPIAGNPGAIAVSGDGELLAIAHDEGQQGTIRVYKLRTGELDGQRPTATAMQNVYVGNNGKLTAFDGTTLYHWKDWSAQQTPLPEAQAILDNGGAVAISSNPELLALFDRSQSMLSIFDLSNGAKNSWPIDQASVADIVFDPSDPDRLASFDYGGTIRLWSASSHQVSLTLQARAVTRVEFSADGRFLAANGDDGTIRVWDIRDGRLVASIFAKTGATASLAVDGAHGIDAIVQEAATQLWQMGEAPIPDLSPIKKVLGLMPDQGLAAGTCDDSYSLCVVRFENGKAGSLVRKFKALASPAGRLIFSRNGRFLAGRVRPRARGAKETTVVWDLTTSAESFAPGENQALLGFTPESDRVILRVRSTNGDGEVKLWDLNKGDFAPAVPAPLKETPTSVAFSPDGHWMATSKSVPIPSVVATEQDTTEQNYRVSVWRWPDGKGPVRTLDVDATVSMISFSSDGHFLITAGGEQFIRVWDRETRKETGRVGLYRPGVPLAMGFADSDRRIVAFDQYSVLNTPWRPEDLMKEVCERVGRPLTHQEWDKYLPKEKGQYFSTCEAYLRAH
jgi:WD40 repeat protein